MKCFSDKVISGHNSPPCLPREVQRDRESSLRIACERLTSYMGMDIPPKNPDEMYPEEGPPPLTLITYVTIQPVGRY